MADGCRTLALLWESAWKEGKGDQKIKDLTASDPGDLSSLYVKTNFLKSYLLTDIGKHLQSSD